MPAIRTRRQSAMGPHEEEAPAGTPAFVGRPLSGRRADFNPAPRPSQAPRREIVGKDLRIISRPAIKQLASFIGRLPPHKSRASSSYLRQSFSEDSSLQVGQAYYIGRSRSTLSSVSIPTSKYTRSSATLPPESASAYTTPIDEDSRPESEDIDEQADDKIYRPDPEEPDVEETANLRIHGETIPDLDGEDSDDKPIRLLSDFVIYTRNSNCLVPIKSLIGLQDSPSNFAASGYVKAWVDPEDEQDSDDEGEDTQTVDNELEDEDMSPQRVKLGQITGFSIHHGEKPRNQRFRLDPKIYIETVNAWYILDQPNRGYLGFYSEFWIKHRIFHILVASTIKNQNLTTNGFLGIVKSEENRKEAINIIGHALTEEYIDTEDMKEYIVDMLQNLVKAHGQLTILKHTPAIKEIIHRSYEQHVRAPTLKTVEKKVVTASQKDAEITLVTPRVYEVAKGLFIERLIKRIGTPVKKAEGAVEITHHPVHANDPTTVEWVKGSELGPSQYYAVIVDGVEYKVGDFVMVAPGDDANEARRSNAQSRAAHSSNSLANKFWFAKICYFIEKEEEEGGTPVMKKFIHAEWLQHGSQILLQEAHHPQGLFWVNECQDIPIETIYQKANVKELGRNEPEPPLISADENNFFVMGLTWDDNRARFIEYTNEEVQEALSACTGLAICLPCGFNHLVKERRTCRFLDGGISYQGVNYHLLDFVYIRPLTDDTDVYNIGQIVDIDHEADTLEVRLYERHDLLIRAERKSQFGGYSTNERWLFRTDQTMDIQPTRIEGKIYVLHQKALSRQPYKDIDWLSHDDHFYVDSSGPSPKIRSTRHLTLLTESAFKYCESCYQERAATIRLEKTTLKKHAPLRGMELFAGAGGLSTGLEKSGFVETKWAVEWVESAAKTYAANHPNTKVYNQSVNVCLEHAIKSFRGERVSKMTSRGEKEPKRLPAMPKPGDVDFIYGGPPCQSFSAMNHNPKEDDYRTTLVCNMLSYVEFYKPKFFMLENVAGFLKYKREKVRIGTQEEVEIKMVVVKFVLKALVGLGYQVHMQLLQAGQYGLPQRRSRVIFWGAKRGLPLPRFPFPTHCAPKDVHEYRLANGDKLHPLVRVFPDDPKYCRKEEWFQFAPHLPVSVEDAISDLPQFDWINPHTLLGETEADKAEVERRLAMGIRRFPATTKSNHRGYAGFDKATYLFDPQTRYQKEMRANAKDTVEYHYTRLFGPTVVERTTNIPMVPGANHSDLPKELLLAPQYLLSNGKSQSGYRTVYERINAKGLFTTALTSMTPNAKGGSILHPNQRRTITIREAARSQGFPDTYKFLSVEDKLTRVVEDQARQIGNAVPVPLALALGKELGKAMFKMWEDQERNGVHMDTDN